MSELLKGVLIMLLGSAGLWGLMMVVAKHYIEKSLSKRDEEEKIAREFRRRRNRAEKKLWQSLGRVIFWIYMNVTQSKDSDKLEESFKNFNAAEEEYKNIDRDIIAEAEGGQN